MTKTITLPFDVALLPVQELRAGALSCLYERGNLRKIGVGDTEIIRMICSAVRDAQWATALYEIEDETVEATDHTFSISYTAFYTLHDIRYKADVEITGAADNTITVSMRGEALSDFQRNRIGLCVLHPLPECAGVSADVVTPDGTIDTATFPTTISPHQPFLDVQQLKYGTANATVNLQFEGDVFETEDQRNWSDSSFKTYSTPQRLPIPATVKKGDTIAQRVTLQVAVNGETAAIKTAHKEERHEQKIPLPLIGFSREPGSPLLNEQAYGLLKKVPFHQYRVTLRLHNAAWKDEWRRARTEAQQLGVLLELVVFFSDAFEKEAANLMAELQNETALIFSLLLLQTGARATPHGLMRALYPALKQTFSNAHIGWGTDGNFADLNRTRPGDAPHDFVSFSLYPQVHASDTRTIIENLETQHHTLHTIRTFTQQPAHVSPVTFAARQVADARQYTAFAAWWLLKTLHNLSAARSLTFHPLTGANGLLQPDNEGTERATPLYETWVQVQAFAPAWLFQKLGADPLQEPVQFESAAGDHLQLRLGGMGI